MQSITIARVVLLLNLIVFLAVSNRFKAVANARAGDRVAVFLDAQARPHREEDGGERSLRMYGDYCTIVITPLTADHVIMIEQMLENQTQITSWTEEIHQGHKVELMLSNKLRNGTLADLYGAGLEPKIAIDSVGELLQFEHIQNAQAANQAGPNDILGRYATLEEIYAWMDRVAATHRHVTIENIGTSVEGTPLKMLTLAKRRNLPIFYLEASPHAREWIGVASVLWTIHRLLNPVEGDAQTSALAGRLEWQFVPITNPDGYNYSHFHDRLWRKNRRTWPRERCIGVDINRNWDIHFRKGQVDRNKCGGVYPGPKAWSEPETVALRDHFLKYTNGDKRIKAYISLHSYGGMWLLPPSFGPKPPDFAQLLKVGEAAARRVTMRHNEKFKAGPPGDLLYQVGGASQDWVHAVGGVKYSYSPELRPGEGSPDFKNGFLLPVDQIIPACEETWEGLKYIARVVAMEETKLRHIRNFRCPPECSKCCKSSTRADHYKCILKKGASTTGMIGCLAPKPRNYQIVGNVKKIECVARLSEDLSPNWNALPASC